MPVTPTYPGIYIQEAPSSTHTIAAAPTNIAVLIGYTHPLKTPKSVWEKPVPVQIFGFQDYVRQFGGFLRSGAYANAAHDFADMAEAVNQFFLNGGTQAYLVGLVPQVLNAILDVDADGNFLGSQQTIGSVTFAACEITDENYVMTISVRPNQPIASPPSSETADIMITYGPRSGPGTITETYRRVSLTPMLDATTPDPNYIETRIGTAANPVSALVTVQSVGSPPSFPGAPVTLPFATALPSSTSLFVAGDFAPALQQDGDLDKLPIFNLMVLPGVTNTTVLSEALAFCERKRAFLIMDPPVDSTADGAQRIQDYIGGPDLPKGKNGALYFPYLLSPDPLTGLATNPVTGKTNEIPPAATVAGIYAATDVSRGVWKAPAGFQATTTNTTGVVTRGRMTDQRQGVLNPLGVNCLRDFPNIGTAIFGARTLVTQTDEQWRYVPVRRMALFLEQTLFANLGWVVFEPNAEPLWTAITQSINTFMLGLFRQGAFQGTTPSQAFNVQCNSQTTTQADINNGIVNIVVAFAPLKPAEFVIITIAQLAGQTQTS
jgi:phage tail sheath protein FI